MAQNVVVPPLDVAPQTVVGSTPQSVFPFDFPFWSTADIIPLVDGIPLTGGFTVAGYPVQNGQAVEGGYGSGVVTLNTPVSNCIVTIDRFVAGSRESQFSRAAPLGMPALNSDLNKLTARQQDLARILDRVPQTAVGETPPTWEAVLTAAGLLGSNIGAIPVVPTGGDTAVVLADQLPVSAQGLGAVAEVETPAASVATISALNKAATAGQLIDGLGQTFAIDGRWTASTPGQSPKVRNATFKQIATTGTARAKTLYFDGLDGVVLENITLDLNGIDAPSGVSFSEANGIRISNCTNVTLRNVRVINGTAQTAILLENCTGVRLENCEAQDFAATYATEPTDDVMQAVSIAYCSDIVAINCGGINLTANWTGRPTPWRRYSRGFVMSGCTNFLVIGAFGGLVDQGIDISGGDNHAGLIANVRAWDCSTYGFKCANRVNHVRVLGGMIERAGWAGVVCSSQFAGTVTATTKNIDIEGFTVIDTGANSIWTQADGRNSFQVLSSGFTGTEGFPGGIRFINCSSFDLQTTKTTDAHYAIRGASTVRPPNSTVPVNELINCRGEGLAAGGVYQIGFNFPDAKVTNAALQSFANNTITKVTFATVARDTSNLFDAANSRVYFKVRGFYAIKFRMSWEPSGAGRRESFFYKNGSEWDSSERLWVSGTSADNTINQGVVFQFFDKGDYFELFARQNAGVTLNLATGAVLQVVKLGEY